MRFELIDSSGNVVAQFAERVVAEDCAVMIKRIYSKYADGLTVVRIVVGV